MPTSNTSLALHELWPSSIGGPLWLDVWIREELVGTYLLLVLGVVTKLVCLITSAKALHENGYVMENEGLRGDVWTMRILVQNGECSGCTLFHIEQMTPQLK